MAVIAAVTVVIGNIVALQATYAVRLLAWSSIAQAGYILLPLGAVAGAVAVGPTSLTRLSHTSSPMPLSTWAHSVSPPSRIEPVRDR